MSLDHASTPPCLSAPRRGVSGAIIHAWGGSDLRLRVLEREEVAEDFLRLRVDLDGLLERDEVYPTYWLRLWFTKPSGKGHQRAYTVVAPDAATGTGWLEFYLHPGIASDCAWCRTGRRDRRDGAERPRSARALPHPPADGRRRRLLSRDRRRAAPHGGPPCDGAAAGP